MLLFVSITLVVSLPDGDVPLLDMLAAFNVETNFETPQASDVIVFVLHLVMLRVWLTLDSCLPHA